MENRSISQSQEMASPTNIKISGNYILEKNPWSNFLRTKCNKTFQQDTANSSSQSNLFMHNVENTAILKIHEPDIRFFTSGDFEKP